jgi:hypothetical protein
VSYQKPNPGRYRRIKDGVEVQVLGSTGIEWNSTVAVQGARLSHVRLENFWKKYEEVAK